MKTEIKKKTEKECHKNKIKMKAELKTYDAPVYNTMSSCCCRKAATITQKEWPSNMNNST